MLTTKNVHVYFHPKHYDFSSVETHLQVFIWLVYAYIAVGTQVIKRGGLGSH